MSTLIEKTLIIEYWFRVLIGTDISIQDITTIAKDFAAEYEEFIPSLASDFIKLESDGTTLITSANVMNQAYGSVTAYPGHHYHKKIQIIDSGNQELRIGIVEATSDSVLVKSLDLNSMRCGTYPWWSFIYGYDYFSGTGNINHHPDNEYIVIDQEYGEEYDSGDIIDIWLDLKDGDMLSFAKNDKQFGKAANVKQNTTYKLAIGIDTECSKIEIIQFEIM